VELESLRPDGEVGFESELAVAIAAIVEAIGFSAENQENNPRMVFLEMLLQQKIFLIGAVADHPKIVNLPLRMARAQLFSPAVGSISGFGSLMPIQDLRTGAGHSQPGIAWRSTAIYSDRIVRLPSSGKVK
jgi:hypothetical protein